MLFAGSDSEMISKLAKNIAHFFVVKNITEESKEVIYAYGMELRNRQPDQRAKKMSRDQPRLKSRIRFITMNCSE